MKIKGYGAHHSKIEVDSEDVEGFYYPCWFKNGWWWTVKMKDGTQFDMFFLEDKRIPPNNKKSGLF